MFLRFGRWKQPRNVGASTSASERGSRPAAQAAALSGRGRGARPRREGAGTRRRPKPNSHARELSQWQEPSASTTGKPPPPTVGGEENLDRPALRSPRADKRDGALRVSPVASVSRPRGSIHRAVGRGPVTNYLFALRPPLAAGGGGRAAKPPQENDAPSYPSPAEEGKAPLPPWLFSNSRICMPRIIKLIIKL
jgi:hypothetical protein